MVYFHRECDLRYFLILYIKRYWDSRCDIILSLASFGIGLSLPSLDTLITEGVDKKIRGSITSIYSSMRFLGVAIGPPIVALMLENIRVLYLILAILSGLAAMIGLLAIKPK